LLAVERGSCAVVPAPRRGYRTQPGVSNPGIRPKPHRALKGRQIDGDKTCKRNVTGIRYSAHIDNDIVWILKNEQRGARRVLLRPFRAVIGSGGFLGLKRQAEYV
jgi:hypothetical protein